MCSKVVCATLLCFVFSFASSKSDIYRPSAAHYCAFYTEEVEVSYPEFIYSEGGSFWRVNLGLCTGYSYCDFYHSARCPPCTNIINQVKFWGKSFIGQCLCEQNEQCPSGFYCNSYKIEGKIVKHCLSHDHPNSPNTAFDSVPTNDPGQKHERLYSISDGKADPVSTPNQPLLTSELSTNDGLEALYSENLWESTPDTTALTDDLVQLISTENLLAIASVSTNQPDLSTENIPPPIDSEPLPHFLGKNLIINFYHTVLRNNDWQNPIGGGIALSFLIKIEPNDIAEESSIPIEVENLLGCYVKAINKNIKRESFVIKKHPYKHKENAIYLYKLEIDQLEEREENNQLWFIDATINYLDILEENLKTMETTRNEYQFTNSTFTDFSEKSQYNKIHLFGKINPTTCIETYFHTLLVLKPDSYNLLTHRPLQLNFVASKTSTEFGSCEYMMNDERPERHHEAAWGRECGRELSTPSYSWTETSARSSADTFVISAVTLFLMSIAPSLAQRFHQLP